MLERGTALAFLKSHIMQHLIPKSLSWLYRCIVAWYQIAHYKNIVLMLNRKSHDVIKSHLTYVPNIYTINIESKLKVGGGGGVNQRKRSFFPNFQY